MYSNRLAAPKSVRCSDSGRIPAGPRAQPRGGELDAAAEERRGSVHDTCLRRVIVACAWRRNQRSVCQNFRELEGEHGNMEIVELAAEPRTAVGKGLRTLRDEGNVPAVVYGHGVLSLPIQINERSLDRWLAAGGANSLVNLAITGVDEIHTVLVREIQRYPTRPKVLHLDFYKVSMTEKIQASVPLVIVGKSRAVSDGTAVMVQNLDDVEVECLPGDLPSSLTVDISGLERTDQHIMVKDIPLPEGVALVSDREMAVISLVPVRQVEEEEAVAAVAAAPEEVEVVAKGKAAKAAELGEEED